MITTAQGNLFDAKAEVLVNTVNTVGVMGKGVALQFKNQYPANFTEYSRACREKALQPGDVLVHRLPALGEVHYIFNVATKQHWRGASRLEYVEKGLAGIVREMQRLGARSIAMPPLGCGLGGLDWNDVRPRIEHAFRELEGVTAFVYEPSGAPPKRRSKVTTARPTMTDHRAVLIALMERYLSTGYEYALTLLEVQKLAYLMQVAGQPLKLQYRKLHYGPYADNLQKVLNRLDGHFIEGAADGSSDPQREISLLPMAVEAARDALCKDEIAQANLERVAAVISGFETPFGMELLATVHWVAIHEGAKTADDAFTAIQRWSDRKAKLIKQQHVETAWDRLQSERLICAASPS